MSHMKARIKLTINGRVCSGRAGQTILEVAQNNGIEIPNLCHNSELKHYGGCSLCVVEAENSPKLLRACATEAQDGQVIYTESERVVRTRKTSIELLMSDHDGDCRGPCVLKCPASVNAQGYVQAIARGDDKEAVRIIKERLPIPASIGRVCPHPCEGGCRRQMVSFAHDHFPVSSIHFCFVFRQFWNHVTIDDTRDSFYAKPRRLCHD